MGNIWCRGFLCYSQFFIKSDFIIGGVECIFKHLSVTVYIYIYIYRERERERERERVRERESERERE